MNDFLNNFISGTYSLALHIVLLGLFLVGMEGSKVLHIAAEPKVEIVQATVIDESEVIEEIKRQEAFIEKQRKEEADRQKKVEEHLKETQEELARKEQEFLDQQERARLDQERKKQEIEKLEQQRKVEEQKKQAEEVKRKEAEKQRLIEEKRRKEAEKERLAEEARKQKMLEERQAAEEKRRLAEADRKAEEQRKRDAEEAKRKAEEAKRKAEKEAKEAEIRKQKALEEERKAEANRLLQESLAAEQEEQDARRVQGVVDKYAILIKQRIKRYWIKPANAQEGLQCTLNVSLLPGGDVKQVSVIKSSGNPVFDRSAESAVYKAAPLPQPTDPKAAAALRDFQFIFKPE